MFITPDALLAHWQGHRRVTRRVIDAFPDDKLFTFSIGGMRPFGALAMEMITMAVPMVQGCDLRRVERFEDRDAEAEGGGAPAVGREHRAARRLWPQIPPSDSGER